MPINDNRNELWLAANVRKELERMSKSDNPGERLRGQMAERANDEWGIGNWYWGKFLGVEVPRPVRDQ